MCIFLICIFALSCPPAISADAPDPNTLYKYVEDGEFSKALNIPTYEWQPLEPPKGIVLAIHGLTLYGKRYEVLGRACAVGGYLLIAADMRGFGRCVYGDKDEHKFCDHNKRGRHGDCRKKVDFEKSFDDQVALARMLRRKYPGVDIVAIGESLGATNCVRLAGKHPDLVDGLVLSGPAMKLNPLMFLSRENLKAGLYAFFVDPLFRLNLHAFESHLVSNDPRITAEMINDPIIVKKMPLTSLLKTQSFVHKTSRYARSIKKDLPVLILQASEDYCVVPRSVTELTKSIPSSDQTLRWLNGYGHLLLETAYIRAGTIDALLSWLEQHEDAHVKEVIEVKELIKELGGKADD